ncbi:MAG TPA: hypothetical protein VKA18_14725 [Alphaproteobacteria bacterium]|nr:hypothetical protein [Alphaproteobacteria bacterium]
MKFGMFYEHQVPRPWDDRSEHRVFHQALEQIPVVKAAGKRRIESGEVDSTGGAFVDKARGGAIPIPHADPRAAAANAK